MCGQHKRFVCGGRSEKISARKSHTNYCSQYELLLRKRAVCWNTIKTRKNRIITLAECVLNVWDTLHNICKKKPIVDDGIFMRRILYTALFFTRAIIYIFNSEQSNYFP